MPRGLPASSQGYAAHSFASLRCHPLVLSGTLEQLEQLERNHLCLGSKMPAFKKPEKGFRFVLRAFRCSLFLFGLWGVDGGRLAQALPTQRPVVTTRSLERHPALPPQRLATRLSFALRGVPPSKQEVAAMAQASSQGEDSYFAAYQKLRDKYLADSLFENRLVTFFADWWGLPQSESARTAAYLAFRRTSYRGSLDSKVLVLSPEREILYQVTGAQLENTGEHVGSGGGNAFLFALDPAELRFRSVLENLDFLDTYPETLTNVNRKRSKQVFERFLCRPLVPDAVSDDVLNMPAPAPDQHVKDETCRHCHYKLDPVARFFDNWRPIDGLTSRYEPSVTAAGTLRLFDPFSREVSQMSGTGLRSLAEMVRNAPDFLRCSVRHVWTFFSGLDLPPQDFMSANADLLNSRDELVGVISNLTEQPYFWTQEMPPPVNFADVSPPLAKCAACHQSAKSAQPAPQFDLLAYPYAEDPNVNVVVLANIWRRIVSTERDMMPPAAFRQIELSPSEIESLRKWISEGGRDKTGKVTLTDEDVKLVLKSAK